MLAHPLRQDIFICNHSGHANKLYRNAGSNTWEDKSTAAGVADTDHTYSASATDYDGDGDIDLFVGSGGGSNKADILYRNDGGSFTAVTTADIAQQHSFYKQTYGISWGDLNDDGIIDLIVAGANMGVKTFSGNGDGTECPFETGVQHLAGDISSSAHRGSAVLGDYDGDGDLARSTFCSALFSD